MVLQPMVALLKSHTEAECTVSHIHKKEVLFLLLSHFRAPGSHRVGQPPQAGVCRNASGMQGHPGLPGYPGTAQRSPAQGWEEDTRRQLAWPPPRPPLWSRFPNRHPDTELPELPGALAHFPLSPQHPVCKAAITILSEQMTKSGSEPRPDYCPRCWLDASDSGPLLSGA